MATYSSILAWENPMAQPGLAGYSPWGSQKTEQSSNEVDETGAHYAE